MSGRASDGQLRVNEERVSLERLDGEIIAIDFASGLYGSFAGPSADLLWLIQTGVAREDWLQIARDAYMEDISEEAFEADVDSFVCAMLAAGFIEEGEGPRVDVESLPQDCIRGAWVSPVYSIQDDLTDLLVIDPIHDVSDDGWPSKK